MELHLHTLACGQARALVQKCSAWTAKSSALFASRRAKRDWKAIKCWFPYRRDNFAKSGKQFAVARSQTVYPLSFVLPASILHARAIIRSILSFNSCQMRSDSYTYLISTMTLVKIGDIRSNDGVY